MISKDITFDHDARPGYMQDVITLPEQVYRTIVCHYCQMKELIHHDNYYRLLVSWCSPKLDACPAINFEGP